MGDLKTKMDLMSTLADTLTQVTITLQQNLGNLSNTIIDMTKSIEVIMEQATKIETLEKKYEET